MPSQTLRYKRGTAAQVAAYIGGPAEPVVNTTTGDVHVQDGITPGGVRQISEKSQVQATGLPTPHIMADWLKYPISLERHGCRGDFNGATGFDNNNRLSDAIGSGEALVVPPGKRYLTGSPLAVTNRPFEMRGAHRSSAIVSPAGVPGMVVSQNSQDNATHISNVAFLTMGQESAAGLSVTYSAADSGQFRNDVRCHIENVVCRGVDYLQHGWDVGIDLVDVHNLNLIRPNVVGRRNYAADNGGRLSYGTMTAGIRNTGTGNSSIPSDAMVLNPLVANAKIGIQSRGWVEGFRIIEPILIAMWQCIDIDNDVSQRPWVRIVGGHLSPIDLGIAVKNCDGATIRDIYMIKGGNAGVLRPGMYPSDLITNPAGTVLVYLKNCKGFNISDLEIVNYAKHYSLGTPDEVGGANIAIVLEDAFKGKIRDINHSRPTVGMYMIGNTGKVETSNYKPDGIYEGSPVSEYVDRSTGGGNIRTDGNKPAGTAGNASAITLSGTPDASVSIFIPNAEAGQRYRFEASVEANVTTSGDTNFAVSNDGGSAVGSWGATGTYISQRGPAAATGNPQGCTINGVYTVKTRGSIVAKLSLQMPSGAGTVGAGKAQLTATLL